MAKIPPAASPGELPAASVFESDQGKVAGPQAKVVGTHIGSTVCKKGGHPLQSQLDTHGEETLKNVRSKSKDIFYKLCDLWSLCSGCGSPQLFNNIC